MRKQHYIIFFMIFLFGSEVYAMMRSMKSGSVYIAKGLDHSMTSRSISMGQAIAIAVGVTILQDVTYADISNAAQGICFLGVAGGVPVYCAIHACKIKGNYSAVNDL